MWEILMTKDNKALFELAAKAAGKSGLYRNDTIRPEGFYCYPDDKYWNPRDNSEDAFDLACELGMSIDVDKYETSSYAYAGEVPRVYAMELWRGDTKAATRLAIFLAAVEVGKNLGNGK
jgi:hypothetical protein